MVASLKHHHNVYVVELSRDVLREPRFKRCNPGYDPAKHKAGIKSNRFVRLYGLRLLPDLYECYNPMPYEGAREMEVELAIGLREEGYGVWQG